MTTLHQLHSMPSQVRSTSSSKSQSRSVIIRLQAIAAILLTVSWLVGIEIAPSSAQERKSPRTLTASGRATVSIPTTLSQVRLAVEVQGKTPINAQQAAANRSVRLVEYLNTQRVDKLQTTGIELNPVYTYPSNGGKPQLNGYAATNSISFRVMTTRAGAILDAAVRNGASKIDGINFSADDRAIDVARNQALKQATQDAQIQADAVLSALNFKRKEVINIRIDSASNPNPIPFQRRESLLQATDAKASTPIIGGEQQIEATVSLDIGY